jgi:nitrogen regulatory protein PII 1
MKMIRAIVRPEKVEDVVDSLDEAGFAALTKMEVIGRGKQRGIQLENIYYDEIPKTMLLIVAEDDQTKKIVEIITKSSFTGNFGDGKIFISPIDDAYTVRTRNNSL